MQTNTKSDIWESQFLLYRSQISLVKFYNMSISTLSDYVENTLTLFFIKYFSLEIIQGKIYEIKTGTTSSVFLYYCWKETIKQKRAETQCLYPQKIELIARFNLVISFLPRMRSLFNSQPLTPRRCRKTLWPRRASPRDRLRRRAFL